MFEGESELVQTLRSENSKQERLPFFQERWQKIQIAVDAGLTGEEIIRFAGSAESAKYIHSAIASVILINNGKASESEILNCVRKELDVTEAARVEELIMMFTKIGK